MADKQNIDINVWARRFFHGGFRSAALFGVLGLASWLMGIPFLWPSLGPTAYVLAFDKDKNHTFEKVFGAHVIGGAAGLLTHQIFAPALTISVVQPLHAPVFKIAVSSIVALALTTGFMRATGWNHSPACATTLIVALGLISHWQGVMFLWASVIIIYVVHFLNEFLFKKMGWIRGS